MSDQCHGDLRQMCKCGRRAKGWTCDTAQPLPLPAPREAKK